MVVQGARLASLLLLSAPCLYPVPRHRAGGDVAVAALILGIIGALTGVAALAWQVITWRRGGAVVAVTAFQAFPCYGDQAGEAHVNLTARNSGRSPVTVNGWGLKLPGGGSMIVSSPAPWSSPLPHRLEPGADGSWYIPTPEVARFCAGNDIRQQDTIAFVDLADGRTISAKQRGIGLAYEYGSGEPSGA